jgi:phosphocarrier protein HPr
MNEWPDEPGAPKVARPLGDIPVPDPAAIPAAATVGSEPMRRTLIIRNSRGLHARAAAKLVSLAERYSSLIQVTRDGQTVPACSIMGLMMLGAGKGAEIVVEAEGWDAKEALEAVAGLIEAGFHED